jgi:hypothetical protein
VIQPANLASATLIVLANISQPFQLNKIDKKDLYHSEYNYFPSPDIETSNIEKSGTNKVQLSPNISIKGPYHEKGVKE